MKRKTLSLELTLFSLIRRAQVLLASEWPPQKKRLWNKKKRRRKRAAEESSRRVQTLFWFPTEPFRSFGKRRWNWNWSRGEKGNEMKRQPRLSLTLSNHSSSSPSKIEIKSDSPLRRLLFDQILPEYRIRSRTAAKQNNKYMWTPTTSLPSRYSFPFERGVVKQYNACHFILKLIFVWFWDHIAGNRKHFNEF